MSHCGSSPIFAILLLSVKKQKLKFTLYTKKIKKRITYSPAGELSTFKNTPLISLFRTTTSNGPFYYITKILKAIITPHAILSFVWQTLPPQLLWIGCVNNVILKINSDCCNTAVSFNISICREKKCLKFSIRILFLN